MYAMVGYGVVTEQRRELNGRPAWEAGMAPIGAAGEAVGLAGERSASGLLHDAVVGAASEFPDVFSGVDVGVSSGEFKKRFGEILPVFEATRIDSDRRGDIARHLRECARRSIVWKSSDGDRPLADVVRRRAEPYGLETHVFDAPTRFVPHVVSGGSTYTGFELTAWTSDLVARGSATPGVRDSIDWIVQAAGSDGLDLSDRKVVILGASAELASTALWLQGGADVLWIDIEEPSEDVLMSEAFSGRLSWVAGGADLLVEPDRIRATIEAFAGEERVDLALYAYAPGQAREWRLTGTMNAIVDALPSSMVGTVSLLLSPTTCGAVSDSDLAGEVARLLTRPAWQATLDRLGALGRGPGHAQVGLSRANRGIVPIQGTSYQAAQYLGKLIVSESWACAEVGFDVSANTAGISLTESLHHPVFDTAFAGAAAFGIETFEPVTTATLNGLLTVKDCIDAPTSARTDDDRLADLTATRVHGGIYQLPYPIEAALRAATAIGVGKDPRRLGGLLRRS